MFIVLSGAVLVIGILGYAIFSDPGDVDRPATAKSEDSARISKTPSRGVVHTRTRKAGRKHMPGSRDASERRKPVIDFNEYEGLSPEDRKLAEAVDAAMDGDDNAKIIAAAVKALASASTRVRQDAVDALGWCGKDALAELTGTLADPDDDVRDSAISYWECALDEVEDPKVRFSTAASVMGIISNEDALDSISGQFTSAADEYIDAVDDESVQKTRRVEVVQHLVDIIDGKISACSEKAKEAYNDLTGYEWRGVAEAEKYLADPDDYEPPDDGE